MIVGIALLELILLAVAVARYMRDRQSLARFSSSGVDAERLKELAMQLPNPYRASATQFAGELARKGPLDELIVQAVTQAANMVYGLSLAPRIAFTAILGIAVLSPLTYTLLSTAMEIEVALAGVGEKSGARVFMQTKEALEPAFDELYRASQATALLCAGMVLVGVVHWLLNRSEAREARFVQALLQAAIVARPGTSAPVASRLSELVAPERSLGLPIAAFAFFFVASGAGWLALFLSANIKEANAADVYNVWPSGSRTTFTPPLGMLIPTTRRGGGSPIPRSAASALSIFDDHLEIAGQSVERDDKDRYPPDTLARAMAQFKEEGSISILADKKLVLTSLFEVLDLLRGLGMKRVYLVIERTVRIKGLPGGDRIHAGIPLRLDKSVLPKAAFFMDIGGSTISIDPGQRDGELVDLHDEKNWPKQLNDVAQKRISKLSTGEAQPEVIVKVSAKTASYVRLLEILSAADTTCERESDCGVPGMGIEFFWQP
jgi:hypothetical protein